MADILRENINESMELAKELLDNTAHADDAEKLVAVTAGLLRGMVPVFQDMLERIEQLEKKVDKPADYWVNADKDSNYYEETR